MGRLDQVDVHPPFRTLLKHKACLTTWVIENLNEPHNVTSFLCEDIGEHVFALMYFEDGSIGHHALGPELHTHACDDMIQLQCNSTSQFTCLDMQLQFHCRNFHRSYFTHLHHRFRSCRQCIPKAHDPTIRARPEVTEHHEVNIHIMTHAADDPTDPTIARATSAVENKRKHVIVV